jgi:hypothetical protein
MGWNYDFEKDGLKSIANIYPQTKNIKELYSNLDK